MTASSIVPQQADFDRAGRELRQSALGLATAWQALQKAGWSSPQLRPVLLALRKLNKGCDRLRLASLRKRANDLELHLVPFVSELKPQAEQAKAIEALVSALTSSVLAFDLNQIASTFFHAKPANDAAEVTRVEIAPVAKPEEAIKNRKLDSGASAFKLTARLSEPNVVAVLRADKDLAPGLIDALKERGHKVIELSTTQALEQLLAQQLPGAVVADARFLNGISRQVQSLKARPGTAERDAIITVISDRKDLGRKLLATRHGASSYFEEPIDVLEVASSLGLNPPMAAGEPTHRALLCTSNKAFADTCGQWLLAMNISTRIEFNAIGALAACLEFQPEILLIDASIPSQDTLRVVMQLRKQSRHQHLPIVLLSGGNSLSHREAAISAGVDEYLIEPIKQRHLQSVVCSRVQRLNRLQAEMPEKAYGGLLPRGEFIHAWQQSEGLSLIFVLLDQFEKLDASYPVSAFEALDTAMSGLLKTRLQNKELAGYFRDGQYMLGVKVRHESEIEDLCDKIRRSVDNSRINLNGREAERLTASIAWTRAPIASFEQALHLCRHSARLGLEQGGNRARSTQATELTHPSNPSQRADVPASLMLQPVLPLSAKLQGQFWLHFIWDEEGGLISDHRTAYAMSKAAGSSANFDRRLLAMALARRSEELRKGRQLRLLMEVGESFLLDSHILSWLSNQLNSLRLSGSGISLFVAFESALEHANAWHKRYQECHGIGMRLGLRFSETDIQPLRHDAANLNHSSKLMFDLALLPERPISDQESNADRLEDWGLLLRRVRERGAISIVQGATQVSDLDQLKSLRVDFALSESLAPSASGSDFDFVGFLRGR